MNEKKVPVNLETLNAALRSMCKTSRIVKTEDTILAMLSEFKRLNIEPSLATYYFILSHFHHRQRRLPPGVLDTVLSKVYGKEHTIRHESDVYFFPFAMNLCCASKNLAAADQLNDTLKIGKNSIFLSNDVHEVRYL